MKYKKLSPFKIQCLTNFPFIDEDFDALTNYGLLCKIVEYINEISKNNNSLIENIENLNNWFKNLDVQDEINNKLDEMAESGQLVDIIGQYINLNSILVFNTMSDLKNANNLVNGSNAITLGFHKIGDMGKANYKIRTITNNDIVDEYSIISLSNPNLIAELIYNNNLTPEMFGAYGDGINDDTNAFNNMLNYVLKHQVYRLYRYATAPVMNCCNTYNIGVINIPDNLNRVTFLGHGKGRFLNGGFNFNATTGWRTTFKSLTFDNCNNPIKMEYLNLNYGKVNIEKCDFFNCTGTTLHIERRSHQVFVKECKFDGCEKTLYINDVDMFYFIDNWVECLTLWNDNHYDIEQDAINEGTIIIKGNLFIPEIIQTSNNPCWIKVGGNAVIENNRFSGENASIYPLIISNNNFDNFSIEQSLYPSVNIINNPMIAGKTSILLDKYCGNLNIKNNSFTGSLPILKVIDESIFNNLDYEKLTIKIEDNTGRNVNFKNSLWFSSNTRPITPKCLQKFIKTFNYFAQNYNLNIERVVDNRTLTLKFNNKSYQAMQTPILISGVYNHNPGGSSAYFDNFLILVSLIRKYDSDAGGLILKPVVKFISENPYSVEFVPKINGNDYILTSSNPDNNIELSIEFTSPQSDSPRVEYIGYMVTSFNSIGQNLEHNDSNLSN